jgi:hypothetical protein
LYFPTTSIQHSPRCSPFLNFPYISGAILGKTSSDVSVQERKARKYSCTKENIAFIVIFLATSAVDEASFHTSFEEIPRKYVRKRRSKQKSCFYEPTNPFSLFVF